ncbi:Asp-tRNA(Asn)/Glu-tRNA(Gln) amidotransferase subunit GatA, partial [bacterium]|nr:Asp-tRNA(Asn)/Glu-tRNA(Gln) amidotransferase subunit GatA [bacterium]
LANKIKSKEVKSSEVMAAFLERSEKLNPKLNAFINMNTEAMDQAKAMDDRIAKGEGLGKLAGVPIGIKDLLCTKGIETTAASKMLKGFVPEYSSTVVNNLQVQGAIVQGKLNLDEFAMGSSNETSFFGDCKNPWNTDYVPGGSSGGSAAAVSALMTPASIGTDTGGSIRQPANFCGIVGLKPTYGRVSRYGIVAFASSLDQAGPMTNSVKDAALMLESIAGMDKHDTTTSSAAVENWVENTNSNIKGMKIGLPKEYFNDSIAEDVKKVIEQTIDNLKAQGAEFVDVSMPLTKHSVAIYYLVSSSEASTNLSRYDGVRFGYRSNFDEKPAQGIEDFYIRNRGEGFGTEVKRRIMLGTYALSSGYYDAYYAKACKVRRLLREQFVSAFEKCDAILSPVTTTTAFKFKERIKDPLAMYTNDIFTTSTNLAGLPGMSVPAGFSSEGLPIGVQLTAPHFKEQTLFNLGQAVEESANLKQRNPDVL